VFKNYFKIALRNLVKHKTFSLINVAGLATGMTGAILILLYIQDELNFDRFHLRADRIYRVVEKRTAHDAERWVPQTAAALAPFMRTELTDVDNAVRMFRIGRFAVTHGVNRFYEGDYLFAERNFFDVFDFSMLQGSARGALTEPRSVVLTESEAKKYFGAENPMGQTLQVERLGDFKITGVLKDIPPNSHLSFSMLFSLSTLPAVNPGFQKSLSDWNSGESITYVLLKPSSDATGLADRLTKYLADQTANNQQESRTIHFQPLTEIHFGSAAMEFDRNANKSDKSTLYVLALIGVLILAIAAFNYMNLATARGAKRSKEVGLRKVVGATRSQLAWQFISEAVLVAAAALAVAFVAVESILPSMNQFTGKQLALASQPEQWLLLIVIGIFIGAVSGIYPAMVLSRAAPAVILKDNSKGLTGKIWLRRLLVSAQFTISIVLIAGTLIVYRQFDFIQNKNLGFQKEGLLVIDINSGNARRKFESMKHEFAQPSTVHGVSVSSRVPGEWKDIVRAEFTSEGDQTIPMYFIGADENFLDVYGMSLSEGRNFSKELSSDSAGVLINETAARMLGENGVVGKMLTAASIIDRGSKDPVHFPFRILGIVKDFNFQSLHETVAPMVLGHWKNPIQLIDYFTIRLETGELQETMKRLEAINQKYDADHPFEFNFLDQQLQRFYESERRMRVLFTVAAALAIGVACLGLFGLVAFSTEQRTKEIGVRKVLGASTQKIMLMLVNEFAKLILLAFVIACPVAYFLMNRWLENFAFRIDPGIEVFVLAGGVTVTLTFLTMGYKAVKAAKANPVEALKYE